MACLAALTGCSQSEQSLMQLASVYEWPDHAAISMAALNGGNCLEVLAANDEILATVYRDSADFLGDAYGVDDPVVLAEHRRGSPRSVRPMCP